MRVVTDEQKAEVLRLRLIDYEVAREAVTALIAFRSQWVSDEEAKPMPDSMLIERWDSESAAFAAEPRYGAEIKRLDTLGA